MVKLTARSTAILINVTKHTEADESSVANRPYENRKAPWD